MNQSEIEELMLDSHSEAILNGFVKLNASRQRMLLFMMLSELCTVTYPTLDLLEQLLESQDEPDEPDEATK